MRSLLFSPADSERKLAKGLTAGADCMLIDLEDSIALDNKARARAMAAEFLRGARSGRAPALMVRINAFDSGLAEADLAGIMPARPDGIMLPKANGIEQAEALARQLDRLEAEHGLVPGSTTILPIMTETAAGLLAAPGWSRQIERLVGVTWGAEDLSSDLGMSTSRDAEGRYLDVFRHARLMTVLAATACRTAAIDTVYVDFRNEDGLARESAAAARDGFTGKMAIHPAQVPIINAAFSVTAAEIDAAEEVVAAFEREGNPGVVSIDGRMYDRPHLTRARMVLARAARQRA